MQLIKAFVVRFRNAIRFSIIVVVKRSLFHKTETHFPSATDFFYPIVVLTIFSFSSTGVLHITLIT